MYSSLFDIPMLESQLTFNYNDTDFHKESSNEVLKYFFIPRTPLQGSGYATKLNCKLKAIFVQNKKCQSQCVVFVCSNHANNVAKGILIHLISFLMTRERSKAHKKAIDQLGPICTTPYYYRSDINFAFSRFIYR